MFWLSWNDEITYWRTDEIVFFRNLTKIGTDENKAIYSIVFLRTEWPYRNTTVFILIAL